MMPGLFAIGNRVITRRLGPPMVGVVEAFAYPGGAVKFHISCRGEIDTSTWDAAYPEWGQGFVVMLSRPASVAEFADFAKAYPKSAADKDITKLQIREWFPIADLKMFNTEELP